MRFNRFYKSIFITPRALAVLGGMGALALLAYFFPVLLSILPVVLAVYIAILLIDYGMLVYRKNPIGIESFIPEKLDLGIENEFHWGLSNQTPVKFHCKVLNIWPACFDQTVSNNALSLQGFDIHSLNKIVTPLRRGKYEIIEPFILIKTIIGFFERKLESENVQEFDVLPARKLPKSQQKILGNSSYLYGDKQVRQKIGHSLEFEQIRDYVAGDDIRDINWKATARSRNLKINQFMEERSQQIICVLDKGRVMKFSFEGMTLLDYAVNASLMLAEISLRKGDKVGMISFEKKVDQVLLPSKKSGHISTILQYLYALNSGFAEPNYEELILQIRKKINQRSLLVLFTSFETIQSLRRNLRYLKMLSSSHLLLVVFFENKELESSIASEAENIEDIYTKTVAKKFSMDKLKIQLELKQHGILSILTSPENLTPELINKYLEIKRRNMI